ncbi:MAG: hypothetical protein FVQ82_07175 [Planctomycetes bacterium]|nr:hypothetical protein [Planctomycetota bacterium]
MTTRKIIALTCIIIASLMVLLTKQHQKIKKLETQIADIEFQHQVRSLVNELRIPSEALYDEHKASRQISEIRQQAYERMQVREFLPYANVFAEPEKSIFHSRFSNVLGQWAPTQYGSAASPGGSIYCPVVEGALTTVSSASYENFWVNRIHFAILSLKHDLDENYRLGKYYNEHPDEFDKVIKPWVLRITRSTHVDTSLKACEILLKKGYKDQEIKEALQQVIERSPSKNPVSRSDIKMAVRLSNLYQLGLDLPAIYVTKPKQEIRKPLDPNSVDQPDLGL